MRNHYTIFFLVVFPVLVNAQTNVFPTTGKVGIGTLSPDYLLTIDAGSTRSGISVISDGDAYVYSDIKNMMKNTSAIPTGRPTGWVISHRKDGRFSKSDNQGSSLEFYSVNQGGGYFAPLSFKSNGDLILVSNADGLDKNVGVGTTNPDEKLTVNGKIHAKEVRIDLSIPAPDYVFKDDYHPLSLQHTEKYIKINQHLPDVPSAAEMKSKGVNVNEMQMLLLRKVEELTLHLIAKDKEIQQLKSDIVSIKDHIK